jgi:hypothetical protein
VRRSGRDAAHQTCNFFMVYGDQFSAVTRVR